MPTDGSKLYQFIASQSPNVKEDGKVKWSCNSKKWNEKRIPLGWKKQELHTGGAFGQENDDLAEVFPDNFRAVYRYISGYISLCGQAISAVRILFFLNWLKSENLEEFRDFSVVNGYRGQAPIDEDQDSISRLSRETEE